jgi:hypothetical protein
MALESGHVVKPNNGWYQRVGEEKKYRLNDTYNKEFWLPVLTDPTFGEWIEGRYRMAGGQMMENENVDISDEDISEDYENL